MVIKHFIGSVNGACQNFASLAKCCPDQLAIHRILTQTILYVISPCARCSACGRPAPSRIGDVLVAGSSPISSRCGRRGRRAYLQFARPMHRGAAGLILCGQSAHGREPGLQQRRQCAGHIEWRDGRAEQGLCKSELNAGSRSEHHWANR